MDAAQRGKACQRAVIGDLRIAHCAPAKACEQAFAGEFGERPQHGQADAEPHVARQPEMAVKPEGERGIEPQKGRQKQGERQGEIFGQLGDAVQRGVYPPKLGGVANQAEPVSRTHGAMRFKLNQAHQAAEQQRHQPEVVIGGESERGGEGEGGEQEAIDGGDLPEAVKFGEPGGGGMGKRWGL